MTAISLKCLFLLWCVNLAPPLLAFTMGERWDKPLDLARSHRDGRPLFGAHKTQRGVFGGILTGGVVGWTIGLGWWPGLVAGVLSMMGDVATSYIKRRLGKESGEVIPVADQLLEGLLPLPVLGPWLGMSPGNMFWVLALFIAGAYSGSLFLNRVLFSKPFDRYPRRLNPVVRFREFRACQVTRDPMRYVVNFEDAIYYHVLMEGIFRLLGIYGKGRANALQVRLNPVTFSFRDLPAAFDRYTILFLSDLHIDGLEGLTDRVIDLIRGIHVDLCILGGDLRMEHHGPFAPALAEVGRLVGEIHASDGVFAVPGNHDCLEMMAPLKEIGVTLLVNDSVVIERNGERLWLVGVDDPHHFKCHDLEAAFQGVPRNAFSILVAHSNEAYREASRLGPKLYLCGHSHGGQIQLPRLGPIFTHSSAPRKFCWGLWSYEGMVGYTSCGVGVSGVPVRFNCRGEVLLATLRRLPADRISGSSPRQGFRRLPK